MRIFSSKPTLSAAAANVTGTAVVVAGMQSTAIAVTGTFVADVEFYVSADGVTWYEAYGHDIGDANHAYAKKVTAPKMIQFRDLGGIQFMRCNVANYVSGAVTASLVGIG